MLRFVTVDNFKSFRERVSVPIGHGVNVVAGENGWVDSQFEVSQIVDLFVYHVRSDKIKSSFAFVQIFCLEIWDSLSAFRVAQRTRNKQTFDCLPPCIFIQGWQVKPSGCCFVCIGRSSSKPPCQNYVWLICNPWAKSRSGTAVWTGGVWSAYQARHFSPSKLYKEEGARSSEVNGEWSEVHHEMVYNTSTSLLKMAF